VAGIARDTLEMVGNTPLVELRRLTPEGSARLLGKVEGLNPSGSVKDRIALAMVRDAEEKGLLQPGYTIVEATSGNTGPALAMVASARGYRLIIVMPESAPPERRRLLMRYGVEVQLTPSYLGMDGACRRAKELAEEGQTVVFLDQFRNPATVRIHRETTAREIWEATGGRVDAFVAGVGTGGTITGVGEVLKERNPSVHIAAVEPAGSPLLSQGRAGRHGIPGIGPDFIPPLLNRGIIDEVLTVTDEEANQMSLRLAREEGILAGVSSGANVVAALRVAQRLGEGKTVVTVLPDTGERYLAFPL
jgi:cysteine synthase A